MMEPNGTERGRAARGARDGTGQNRAVHGRKKPLPPAGGFCYGQALAGAPLANFPSREGNLIPKSNPTGERK